ncbi:MAG: Asp-tRNA(Asn)/Glu-tRNA(Gln) amidotransferase subunit GatC [Deltaproteobacteria bacterium]|nr:MAG: Asp-tRNA(Asn)/Glu-tRNA(Gln) amidotransferase subunit GatC [Deltaproteobacteria bacterium]
MKLPREEIDAIAHLARLALTDDEADALCGELGAILAHVAALSEVDTTGVEPMTHAVPMDLRLRADEVEPSLPAELAVGAAPDRDGDYFRVPKVIDG